MVNSHPISESTQRKASTVGTVCSRRSGICGALERCRVQHRDRSVAPLKVAPPQRFVALRVFCKLNSASRPKTALVPTDRRPPAGIARERETSGDGVALCRRGFFYPPSDRPASPSSPGGPSINRGRTASTRLAATSSARPAATRQTWGSGHWPYGPAPWRTTSPPRRFRATPGPRSARHAA